MTNLTTYKGYTASIEFDIDDKIIVGRILGIDDIIVFHGASQAEFETRFHEAVDAYVATSEMLGQLSELGAAQRAELDQRIADCEAHPEDLVSWDEVKAEVRKCIAKVRS